MEAVKDEIKNGEIKPYAYILTVWGRNQLKSEKRTLSQFDY